MTVNERRHIYAPIVTAMKGASQKIFVFHMKWWRSLSIIIINICDGPWMSPQHILLRCHLWWRSVFWWQRLLSVTIAHMKWWRSLSVTINHYWWWTLNVTTTPILSAMPPLVTFSFWWRRLFWPSPMSLWWPFSPLTNVLFSCSVNASFLSFVFDLNAHCWSLVL